MYIQICFIFKWDFGQTTFSIYFTMSTPIYEMYNKHVVHPCLKKFMCNTFATKFSH